MKGYGLIGYPLGHSFSPSYFKEKFTRLGIDNTYRAFELEKLNGLGEIIKTESLSGLNVTIPHKESILSFLDDVTTDAQLIGAVNCVSIKNGQRIGHNTDWIGFKQSIKPLLSEDHRSALILGTGGSSKAVQYALQSLDIRFETVSRTGKLMYENLTQDHIEQNQIIINTTPIGMFPNIEEQPNIPYAALSDGHIVYDLIYNPTETLFLKSAKNRGAQVKNGRQMLELQADASWDIWNQID